MPPWTLAWQPIAAQQRGIIAREQLLGLGLTGSQARRYLANGQWRTVFPGVYATQVEPVSDHGRAWAGLLYAGDGAALSHGTALWWDEVLDAAPTRVHLTIPEPRRVASQDGLHIHRSAATAESVHPSRSPRRTRFEHSVLDHLDGARPEVVVDVLTRSTQRRMTNAARLREALAERGRHANRSLIVDVLAEVDQGVQSPLERRYLRDVERAHGLPRGIRNRPEKVGAATRYRDVRYAGHALVVELDGWSAHPPQGAFRDHRRDNELVLSGQTVLRFGWTDVVGRPCDVAAQVAAALRVRGWPGAARICRSHCILPGPAGDP